ncbi:hypothetical protein [Streptomyces sp. NBC_00038]|uniref:hypothetical protein n=1 Tax=Streptomyces sp. NBC_00038 TaxID=2903615 RepID=UPI00224F7878|nr:hypothetical protein [Streptomyces sp. NBC_00038]MCX5560248.1 hypothetical protein [Streptomyces sp. NBC_00038]
MSRDENEVVYEGWDPSWGSKGSKPGGGSPSGPGLDADSAPGRFEAQLRELLAEDAYAIAPSPAPCATIQRQGRTSSRRRAAATGVVLVTLAAVPAGAYAFGRTDSSPAGTDTVVGTASPTPSAPPTATSPSPSPSGPAGPATPGQLVDGITLSRAADGLDACIAYNSGMGFSQTDLGTAADYRILLAMNSTGDDNAPGDGIFVVAVKEKPKSESEQMRVICNVKDGKASGINISGSDAGPDTGHVVPDMNGGKLYKQTIITSNGWKLPFRWGSIGTVDSSVAKVTVTYGGSTSEAALDHGWFAATGILEQQVTAAPRIKGYDADGKLVYDSDQDKFYAKTLS